MRNVNAPSIAFGLACVSLVGVASLGAAKPVRNSGVRPLASSFQNRSGIDVSAIDKSVAPGDDFDSYASGRWRDRAVIPADEGDTGTVSDMTSRTRLQLREILERSASRPVNADQKLLGAFYSAYLDEGKVEKLGAQPLLNDLAEPAAIQDKSALAEAMGARLGGFGRSFFGATISVDNHEPTRHVLKLRQDGLGLGRPEAYLNKGSDELKREYLNYVRNTLVLAGWPNAAEEATRILEMEQAIAAASWTVVESNDAVRTYNPVSREELKNLAPDFPWDAFLKGAGLASVDRLVVVQKSAFPKIAQIYARTPLSTLKAWEAFNIADQASPYLSKKFAQNRFDFRDRIQGGVKEQAPRWKQATNAANVLLRDPLGKEYVQAHFTPEAKARIELMAQTFRQAMARRIQNVAWMSPATKAKALEKLRNLKLVIGYSGSWRDYRGLSLDRNNLYHDVAKIRSFNWASDVADLGKAVDRGRMRIGPQVVDAFSDSPRMMVGYTAAILQPPLFDMNADMAANYGGIGEALGHEITHQFDDQGRKTDASGRLQDWWQPEDAARFERAARKLARQYSAFEVVPGGMVNGEQTLSENIADLGGLLLAVDAYHIYLNGRKAPVIDGLTGDQRLFLAWARVFRSKETEQSLRQQVNEGTHTPFRYRAIGPMRNIDAWYQAFGVKPGQKYYVAPEDRVRIW